MADTILHIASVVVKARPAVQDAVAARIAALAGAEVLMVDRGRIVVVLESDRPCDLADMLNRIGDLDEVMSATLVFEHSEPDGDEV
ncbi:MAG: chaperone NapD [Acetobacteraceae bacterium]